MNTAINVYLKVRKMVLFMAHPIFYLIAYTVGFFMIDEAPIVGDLIRSLWTFMKDISNNAFLAGTGNAQKDLHLILTILLPTIIALAWWLMEKISGIDYLLKRNQLIS